MGKLHVFLSLSLTLLLVSWPAIRHVAAFEDEGDFGDFGGDDAFPEGGDYGDLEGMGDMGDMGGMGGMGGGMEEDTEIPEGDDGDVVAFTNETLAAKVASGKPFLVEFYAPWCGHCKSLAPHFREAAAALRDFEVTLGKVDATKHEKSAMDYGVEGYPTILWVVGTQVKQFNGGRTSADIVAWVKKRIGLAVKTLKTAEEAEQALEENSAVVAGYFKDLKSNEAEAFAASAKDADDVEYVQTDDVAVAEALGMPAGKAASVAVIKKEDDKFIAFEGEFTAEAITQFAMANRLPLFVTFSDDSAQNIFGGSIKKMVFLFFPSEEHAELTKEFAPIAREHKGKLIFIYINSADENMDNVREFFSVTSEDRLALGFSTEKREDGEKFAMGMDLTFDNLKAFASDFLAGKAKAFFKSEPIPEENAGPVTVVVGNNFQDVVLDPTKDVLLEVYAPWCGHCKSLEPIYKKLGEKFEGIDSVVIAKMDGTANEHHDAKVEGFPTLLFYPAKDKTPVNVEAERKLSALVDFIKEHASTSFTAPEVGEDEDVGEASEEEEFNAEEELGEPSDEDLADEAELAQLAQKDEL